LSTPNHIGTHTFLYI